MSVTRLSIDRVSMEKDQNGELVLYSEHTDAIAKLEAENAALKEENERLHGECDAAVFELCSVKARVAELEADSRRYLWLRKQYHTGRLYVVQSSALAGVNLRHDEDFLDGIIDIITNEEMTSYSTPSNSCNKEPSNEG